MVSEDRMQKEIDRATTAVGMVNEVDLYSLLLRIKHAQNRDEVLDRELKLCRFKLETKTSHTLNGLRTLKIQYFS